MERKEDARTPSNRRQGISRAFYYLLKKRRKAPREMAAGTRRIITPEAEREWELDRESEAAALCIAPKETD
jgi:hypothetical protein